MAQRGNQSRDKRVVFTTEFVGLPSRPAYEDLAQIASGPRAPGFTIEFMDSPEGEATKEQNYLTDFTANFVREFKSYYNDSHNNWYAKNIRLVLGTRSITDRAVLKKLWATVEEVTSEFVGTLHNAQAQISNKEPRKFIDTFAYFCQVWRRRSMHLPSLIYWADGRYVIPVLGETAELRLEALFAKKFLLSDTLVDHLYSIISDLLVKYRHGIHVDLEPVAEILSLYANLQTLNPPSGPQKFAESTLITRILGSAIKTAVSRFSPASVYSEGPYEWLNEFEAWIEREQRMWLLLLKPQDKAKAQFMGSSISGQVLLAWVNDINSLAIPTLIGGDTKAITRINELIFRLSRTTPELVDVATEGWVSIIRKYIVSVDALVPEASDSLTKGYLLATLAEHTLSAPVPAADAEDTIPVDESHDESDSDDESYDDEPVVPSERAGASVSFKDVWKEVLMNDKSAARMLAEVAVNEIQRGEHASSNILRSTGELVRLLHVRNKVGVVKNDEAFYNRLQELLVPALVPREVHSLPQAGLVSAKTMAALSDFFGKHAAMRAQVMWRDLVAGQNSLIDSSEDALLVKADILSADVWENKRFKAEVEPVWPPLEEALASVTNRYRDAHEKRHITWSAGQSSCEVTLGALEFECSAAQGWLLEAYLGRQDADVLVRELEAAVGLPRPVFLRALKGLIKSGLFKSTADLGESSRGIRASDAVALDLNATHVAHQRLQQLH